MECSSGGAGNDILPLRHDNGGGGNPPWAATPIKRVGGGTTG